MASKKDKDSDEKEKAHADRRQIVPVPDGPLGVELFEAIESWFHLRDPSAQAVGEPGPPDAFPERIVLRPVYGADGRNHGAALMSPEWKPTASPAPTREQLVVLANQLIARARRHATVIGKSQRYIVAAYSALKGVDAYESFPFVLANGPREFGEHDAPPDEETGAASVKQHLEMSLQHQRWMVEQHNEMISAILARDAGIIARQDETITALVKQRDFEHIERVKLREETLDRAVERESKKLTNEMKQEGMRMGFALLQQAMPSLIAGITKGKTGLDLSVKNFFENLSPEEDRAIFGEWNGDEQRTPGILTGEQSILVRAIVNGKEPPARLLDLFNELVPPQIEGLRQVLRPEVIASLAMLQGALSASVSGAPTNGASRAPNGAS